MITTTKGRKAGIHRILLVEKDETKRIGTINKMGYSKWRGIISLNGRIFEKQANTKRDIVDYFNNVKIGIDKL
jgi:hypothetical protein